MDIIVKVSLNEKLYVRDPEDTELGRKIIQYSIRMMHKQGFESFTFKKLAEAIGTTEASVYRYFENKHRLLLYLSAWYWSWLQFRISFLINNMEDPGKRLKSIIRLLASKVKDDKATGHIQEHLLHQVIIQEGSKAYMTRHVNEDNKEHFFKPYKDLVAFIADIIQEISPHYEYPRSLASTIIEMAHHQNFFKQHLPSLTDFGKAKNDNKLAEYLESIAFAAILKNKK